MVVSPSPSSFASQRRRIAIRGRPISDPPLCLTQPVDCRPSLPSIARSSSIQSLPPPTSFSFVCHLTQPKRTDLSCSLSPSEVTFEFLGFTAGLIGDSSPLLGITRLICASFGITRLICASFGITRLICASFGITRLICASDEITRLIDVRVWRGARRMREGHMDASGFLYASADHNILELLGT
ncbi:hypothetical protein E5676_scaffold143G002030 [Cucumis melo var. makuwa]|uniref:Uncharacterized protein n=1 Tax=Cucumis melo var. makuwa TaxID=1194695 RepID=A0A5D3C0S9_CUCMM|nr:hypothetical protein E5676_scaffold143G002030 [Cucumis melo var. makuwa]